MFTRFAYIAPPTIFSILLCLNPKVWSSEGASLIAYTLMRFLAGVGLYQRSRFAWVVSIIIAVFAMPIYGLILISGIAIIPYASDPTDGAGYMFIMGGVGLTYWFVILIGLIVIRRDSCVHVPTKPVEPTGTGRLLYEPLPNQIILLLG